ncbi:hypothetical protein SAMN05192558_10720 [Actinokineospora alba]|uniref:Cobyrinic acid a,c-diamide synthase n=1 Tax=Actinokineospora alba TaxID=504798 RepID=A0A1H0QJV9_9PSEU|nr:hypothetical protein [Actinokineospora alba]TDP70517.1 hypothetical protein C8E96_6132 [Actinokineospora alba]SDI29545.1 hypothetical protein SAMN05421871_10419 [Actinokineospora alba]SDP17587.1 hypothetical protein SAMN05192558_10720 [Actinokineospora alba]
MTRRSSLPGAAELFRPTGPAPQAEGETDWFDAPSPEVFEAPPSPSPPPVVRSPRGTPRQKHNSKITVYVSDEELLALEHARLTLRAAHGLAVDRGRVVREAISVILADLEAYGEDSVLVRRLRQDTGQ